jgi:putative (di)nucleoside polyphosphate hydrolase
MSSIDNRPYRKAVGAVVLNPKEYVLTGKRNWPPHLWKMPQGGIHNGETPEDALRRELKEETGLMDVTIQRQSRHEYIYHYPRNPKADSHRHKGQQIAWFLVSTAQNKLDPTKFVPPGEEPEFIAFQWAAAANIIALSHNERLGNYVSLQRKEMYRQVLTEFGLLSP